MKDLKNRRIIHETQKDLELQEHLKKNNAETIKHL